MNLERNAIKRGSLILLKKKDALGFVEEGKSQNIKLLGIDAFNIYGPKIQPSLADSIDFSNLDLGYQETFSEAKDFLDTRSGELYFEMVYERR